jgi:hypothetical protein
MGLCYSQANKTLHHYAGSRFGFRSAHCSFPLTGEDELWVLDLDDSDNAVARC